MVNKKASTFNGNNARAVSILNREVYCILYMYREVYIILYRDFIVYKNSVQYRVYSIQSAIFENVFSIELSLRKNTYFIYIFFKSQTLGLLKIVFKIHVWKKIYCNLKFTECYVLSKVLNFCHFLFMIRS